MGGDWENRAETACRPSGFCDARSAFPLARTGWWIQSGWQAGMEPDEPSRASPKDFANALLSVKLYAMGSPNHRRAGWTYPHLVFSDWEGIWRLAATNLWLTVSARCGRCGHCTVQCCTRPGDNLDQTCLLQSVPEDKHQ